MAIQETAVLAAQHVDPMINLTASIHFALMFGAFAFVCGLAIGWMLRGGATKRELAAHHSRGMERGVIMATNSLEECERVDREHRKATVCRLTRAK